MWADEGHKSGLVTLVTTHVNTPSLVGLEGLFLRVSTHAREADVDGRVYGDRAEGLKKRVS